MSGRRHGEGLFVKFDDDEYLDDDGGDENPTLIPEFSAFRVVEKLEGGRGEGGLIRRGCGKREEGRGCGYYRGSGG